MKTHTTPLKTLLAVAGLAAAALLCLLALSAGPAGAAKPKSYECQHPLVTGQEAVNPKGISTCARPGTGPSDCGAGIAAGAKLAFTLVYSSGDPEMDEQQAAIVSWWQQAGIKLTLKAEPFNSLISTVGVCNSGSHPASTCGWQLVDFGYDPYDLYPAGDGIFNTDSNGNQGGYSSAEEDTLINETEYGGSAQTFFAYEDYTAEQLPWLWVPLPSNIQVYKSNLAGYSPLNPFTGGLNPEDWYYTK